MSITDLWNNWKLFWFRAESPLNLSIFRILYGLIVLQFGLLLLPDLFNWFGTHSICSPESSKKVFEFLGPTGLNVFDWLPRNDTSAGAVYWTMMASAICLTIGFHSRISAILVYVTLASLQQQNGLIINGGAILLKMTAFYLIFAPTGYFLSADSFLKKQKVTESISSSLRSPSGWAQQMMRFLIALIYFQAFWSKMEEKSWMDGTAIYYVLRQQEFMRFPVEWIANSMWMCQTLSWGTLIIEAAMFSLIWFKETRYYVIAAALFLHLGIEYTMNLPIFETLMMAYLVLFIPSEDIKQAYEKIRAHFNSTPNEPLTVKEFAVPHHRLSN